MSSSSAPSVNANVSGSSSGSPSLDQLVEAKIGCAVDLDCIPAWDKARIAEGKLLSFLDDPQPESERIRVSKAIIGSPDALVIALQPDSPQFIPVSGMTLEALEQAVFDPPSKEREFFFVSQKERDTFRVSLGKAAGQGEDASANYEKLVQFIFRKVVVALGKGILRQVLLLKEGDQVLTVLKHRGLFSTDSNKIQRIREKDRLRSDPKQTRLNFSSVPSFAEEEKETEVVLSDSEDDLLSSEYGDLFSEESTSFVSPSLFKRRKINPISPTTLRSHESNTQVNFLAVPFGSALSPLSFLSLIGEFEEQLRLSECSSAKLNAMDTP